MSTRIGKTIYRIFESLWNNDLIPNFDELKLGVDGLEDWHDKSARNDQFYADMTFQPHRQTTLGSLLAWCMKRTEAEGGGR